MLNPVHMSPMIRIIMLKKKKKKKKKKKREKKKKKKKERKKKEETSQKVSLFIIGKHIYTVLNMYIFTFLAITPEKKKVSR